MKQRLWLNGQIGVSNIPQECVRTDLIEFTNAPEDELSIHILRLLSLHLKSMNEEQKKSIKNLINTLLGIKEI